MACTQAERLVGLDMDMPGGEPATLEESVMRICKMQDDISYAAGVADTEAKIAAVLDKLRNHSCQDNTFYCGYELVHGIDVETVVEWIEEALRESGAKP